MLNQVILVGRLQDDPTLEKLPDGTLETKIVLNIVRGFKEVETGDYKTDAIPITLWGGIAENTVEYCKAGATIGVKARLSVSELGTVKIIAEKVTFINTRA